MPHIFAQRGKAFEDAMVAAFNDNHPIEEQDNGWHARRLGGTSSGLPDLLITNIKKNMFWSVECKSTYNDRRKIERTQIDRAEAMFRMFRPFANKNLIFAFKFATKKPRKHHIWIYKINYMFNVRTFIAYTNGTTHVTPLERSKGEPFAHYQKYDSFESLKNNWVVEELTTHQI